MGYAVLEALIRAGFARLTMSTTTDPCDLTAPATNDRVDSYVQRWVAGTNGNLYVPLINKLPRYPIPEWRAGAPRNTHEWLLDIGCGWGRWLVSGAQAGYSPIGLDIKVDALHAARRVLKHHKLRGYVVAADLRRLPFRDDVFDKVFSYSVLQHTHRRRCFACLRDIWRILRPGGCCYLEFPIRHGLTNWRHLLRTSAEDDYESWCVRYYSRRELRRVFVEIFGDVVLETDCFLGIGVQREDLDLLPWKYKPVVVGSELLKRTAKALPFVRWLSDSVFVSSRKAGDARPPVPITSRFGPDDNLWILPWLVCPVTQCALEYDVRSHTLVSQSAGLRYPIDNDVPVLIEQSANKL